MRGLLDGGADLLIVETCQDLLRPSLPRFIANDLRHFEKHRVRVPVIAQVTIGVFGTCSTCTEIEPHSPRWLPSRLMPIGMICGTGPRHAGESIRYL